MQNLSEEELEEFKQVFALFDKDGSGTISAKEIGNVLRALGQNLTEAELVDLVRERDKDGNGELDLEEFIRLWGKMLKEDETEEDLLEAFNVYDKDGDGLISLEDLKHALLGFDDEMSDEEIMEMIAAIDFDKDGFVSYEEFVEMMTQVSGPSS